MKHIYALLTENCNLNCPHCNIKDDTNNYHRDSFLQKLRDIECRITLFGGEPLLYMDRIHDIIDDIEIRKKISSITTNLLLLDKDRLNVLKNIKYGIGTSWNPHRFNNSQYKQWLQNLHILAEHNLCTLVLVTLTPDLFKFGANNFMEMIKLWDPKSVQKIRFEHLVASNLTEEYYEDCDQWLCDIYDGWNNEIKFDNISWKDQFYFDCSEEMTLYPDGRLENHCPNHEYIYIPMECYDCERSINCRPCRLQKYCSYPKNFIDKLRRDEL